MDSNLINLEKKINIKFKNFELLIKSLTHKSYDSIHNNEKLEFLGDRVLGLVITKKLLEIYPEDKEGVLDKKLASLVNKKKCFETAKSLGLEKFVLVGKAQFIFFSSDYRIGSVFNFWKWNDILRINRFFKKIN